MIYKQRTFELRVVKLIPFTDLSLVEYFERQIKYSVKGVRNRELLNHGDYEL